MERKIGKKEKGKKISSDYYIAMIWIVGKSYLNQAKFQPTNQIQWASGNEFFFKRESILNRGFNWEPLTNSSGESVQTAG